LFQDNAQLSSVILKQVHGDGVGERMTAWGIRVTKWEDDGVGDQGDEVGG
jgi:hypothetical protein